MANAALELCMLQCGRILLQTIVGNEMGLECLEHSSYRAMH